MTVLLTTEADGWTAPERGGDGGRRGEKSVQGLTAQRAPRSLLRPGLSPAQGRLTHPSSESPGTASQLVLRLPELGRQARWGGGQCLEQGQSAMGRTEGTLPNKGG